MFLVHKKMVMVLMLALLYGYAIWRERQSDSPKPIANNKQQVSQDITDIPDATVVKPKQENYNERQNVVLSEDTALERKKTSISQKQVPPKIPQKLPVKTSKSINQKKLKSFVNYVVKKSDNLWNIARKFYKTKDRKRLYDLVEEIIAKNPCLKSRPNNIKIGLMLRIPINKKSKFAKKKDNILLPTSHLVKAGETLRLIAEYYYNNKDAWIKILNANPSIKDGDLLKTGSKLVIPLLAGAGR